MRPSRGGYLCFGFAQPIRAWDSDSISTMITMSATNLFDSDLPEDLKLRICAIAKKTRRTNDEVITDLMRTFFEMVDEPEKPNEPSLVTKVREAHRKSSDSSVD
jgi:hypothetical protein